MIIAAGSDIHDRHKLLDKKECDLLIIAGDYTHRGEPAIIRDFCKWLNSYPAEHIILGQGNHEKWVQHNFEQAKQIALEECPRLHFVEHEQIIINGIKIFYSAWTPYFHNWAYNAHRSLELAQKHQLPYINDKWKDIPNDTEILVTHGPPSGILDMVYYIDGVTPKEAVGCAHLMRTVNALPNLKHHIFGHIHCSHGYKYFNGKHFYNVANCGETYDIDNQLTIIET